MHRPPLPAQAPEAPPRSRARMGEPTEREGQTCRGIRGDTEVRARLQLHTVAAELHGSGWGTPGVKLAYSATMKLKGSCLAELALRRPMTPHVLVPCRGATTKRMVLPSSELREYVPPASWFLHDVDGMVFEELMTIAMIAPIYFVLPDEMQHHHLTRDMVVALTIKANSVLVVSLTSRPPRVDAAERGERIKR
ncbi:hypothetical protein HU200_050481 [Digitaria exilis]|uniref:Uncharacterized protein n=1 Tax=Digitaria exilis TaxID=1010633 RepID=A0A835E5X3_9POAL|nr:hypothetical protein HU200_050481 [Digitaria exilis]